LEAKFEAYLDKIRPQRNKLGRFILATNDLNNPDMDEANMLSTYKEQQGVERGFRFIKDPLFHLSGVFFEKARENRRADDGDDLVSDGI
jgi:transposase